MAARCELNGYKPNRNTWNKRPAYIAAPGLIVHLLFELKAAILHLLCELKAAIIYLFFELNAVYQLREVWCRYMLIFANKRLKVLL